MVVKSPTLLRLYAGWCTILGFSIGVLGLVRVKGLVDINWYWAWNFLAEGLGVVALCFAIIHVASGFYVMKGPRIIYHPISATELHEIRNTVIVENNWNETIYYWTVANFDAEKGRDSVSSGLSSWRELTVPENLVFARPSSASYIAHQHHRRTASVIERPVNSDMVAIGVWYLSTLCSLAVLYFILNVFFATNHSLIYNPQMQAFDLCLRMTIAPLLFTPAPKRLVMFYRKHLRDRSKNSSSAGQNNSYSVGQSGDRNKHRGSGNDSGNDWRFANFSSPDSTRVGSGLDKYGSFPRDSLEVVPDKIQDKHQNSISSGDVFHQVKLFQTRDRGCSVESSRVLIKDYETVSTHPRYTPDEWSDSFHNYSDFEMNHHPLQT
ncbi:hypothetical protein BGZ76_003906, partial [Entomortierella beljakovae]